jgi:CDP-diacylglycerol--glycerol-3-phosphate 3-phosphatidyltransferase
MTPPDTLRRQWGVVGVVAIAGLLAVASGVQVVVSGPGVRTVLRWLLPTAAVAGFGLWFTHQHLGANRPADSGDSDGDIDGIRLYRSLGVPNLVTLFRGFLFAALAGFGALSPRPAIAWIPALLYGAGCALDAVDGFLARRADRRTVLGAKLDLAFDTTGFLVAPVVAVLWGQLPVWYLSLSAARYLFKAGRQWRRRRGKPVYDLPDSRLRRPLAGLQMAFITFALAPLFPLAAIRPMAAAVLVPSLALFIRDYSVVAGWVRSDTDRDGSRAES